MKMESSILANKSGIVKDIFVKEGENVDAGCLLLKVE
jgi:biotin carboxyl carrier protein